MTDHVITGPIDSLRTIYNKMVELRNMDKPLEENGFGKTWLGCLVIAFGGDWEKVACRGSWGNEKLNEQDGTLTFYTEYAWTPPFEFLDFLKSKFPVKSYFISEEDLMGEYYCNDINGRYFPERYVLRRGENSFYSSYPNEEKLIEAIIKHTPFKNVKTLHDFSVALERYNDKHEDDELDWQYIIYTPLEDKYAEY